MSRFFALPILATVLAAVGARALAPSATPAPTPAMIVELPPAEAREPAREIAPTPAVPIPVQEAPVIAAPPPIVIVLEPLPLLPPPPPFHATEVIERTVFVPQTTVVTATTHNYFPVEPAPAPRNEVVEAAVIQTVFVCPAHHRPGCCVAPAPRHALPQDTFFRTIPFMPTKPLPGIEQAIKPAETATQRRAGEAQPQAGRK